MSSTLHRAKPIFTGFEWRLSVNVQGLGIFEPTATFIAHVRSEARSDQVLARLSSADGTIVCKSLRSIELIIPASVTESWTVESVELDVVRTDLDEPEHLGFKITIPVAVPVTREPKPIPSTGAAT